MTRKLLALLALACSADAATLYRIACGSPTGGTDAQGHAWQSDAYYSGGVAYSAPALAALDLPYRTLRYGASAFAYSLPVAPGRYTVTLHFLENRTAASVPSIAAGQRKFSVSVNGTPAATSLDLFAVAGSMHPYTLSVTVTVASGPLTISVAPSLGNAVLSGIQVDSVDAQPPMPSTQITCQSGSVTSLDLSGPESYKVVDVASDLRTSTRILSFIIAEDERFLGAHAGVSGLMQHTVIAGQYTRLTPTVFPDTSDLPLGDAAVSTSPLQYVMPTPDLSNSFGFSLGFTVDSSFDKLTSGKVRWELCYYDAAAAQPPQPPPGNKATLEECMGSGPGWNCAGIFRATVDGAPYVGIDGRGVAVNGPALWIAK